MSFGVNVDMLKNAMAGAGTAHQVIANNVANVNTPHFKRSEVAFKEQLAASLPVSADPTELPMSITHPTHIQGGPDATVKPFGIKVEVQDDQSIRVDGSNVDIDQEMAKLSLNSSYAQAMGQFLGNQYTRIRQAIQERA